MLKHKSTILFLFFVLLLSLAACGGNSVPSAPEAYTAGEDTAPPLDSILAEDADALVSIQGPEQEDGGDAVPAGGTTVYTYADLSSGGDAAKRYADALTSSENGFTIVDEEGSPADVPDYSQSQGQVILARDSSAEGRRFSIQVEWTESGCVVTVCQPEGAVVQPAKAEPMTMHEAIDYLKSYSPAVLGLSGASMQDYSVYPKEGTSSVDGKPCIQLNVYRRSEAGTNDIAGAYLMTGDRSLYRLDPVSGAVQPIGLS